MCLHPFAGAVGAGIARAYFWVRGTLLVQTLPFVSVTRAV